MLVNPNRDDINPLLASARQRAIYNNFYEFGLDQDDPAESTHTLETRAKTRGVERA